MRISAIWFLVSLPSWRVTTDRLDTAVARGWIRNLVDQKPLKFTPERLVMTKASSHRSCVKTDVFIAAEWNLSAPAESISSRQAARERYAPSKPSNADHVDRTTRAILDRQRSLAREPRGTSPSAARQGWEQAAGSSQCHPAFAAPQKLPMPPSSSTYRSPRTRGWSQDWRALASCALR